MAHLTQLRWAPGFNARMVDMIMGISFRPDPAMSAGQCHKQTSLIACIG